MPFLKYFANREVIIEKHWRGLTNRNVCDFFLEEVNKYREREDVPPIIATSKHYLVSVFRDDLFVLAVMTNEVSCFRLSTFLGFFYMGTSILNLFFFFFSIKNRLHRSLSLNFYIAYSQSFAIISVPLMKIP